MISSMTGYGKGEAEVGDGRVTVEVRSVNHRFLDLSIRLPRALSGYEREMDKAVRRKIRRGHVYVTVSFDRVNEEKTLGINREFLRKVYRELSAFAREEGIAGTVDINTLLALHETFRNDVEDTFSADSWPAVMRALQGALDRCVDMRREEGIELQRDMLRRLARIEKTARTIERGAPRALKRTLAKARRRLALLISDAEIDENRWIIEAAVIAERTDFSEELVRLASHVRQFRTMVEKGGEVSKKLTFLLQEIHREATTMGNKATESMIIRQCIAIKEDAEKIREQIQNVE